jgi:hypothetical protein
MRVGLLGSDSDTADILRAIRESPTLECIGICNGPPMGVSAIAVEDWLGAPAGQGARRPDVVIVARGGDPGRLEQARQLARGGVPLVVCHPFSASSLDYYELEMAAADAGTPLVPWTAESLHPAVIRVASLASARRSAGAALHVELERVVPALGRAALLDQLAADLPLILTLSGELTRVSAVGPPADAPGGSTLSVQLAGTGEGIARWSGRTGGTPGLRATCVTGDERLVLDLPGRFGDSSVERQPSMEGGLERFGPVAPGAAMMAQLARWDEAREADSTWAAAIRASELAEAAVSSLSRGKTIDLSANPTTEEGTFKGFMSSVGCLLLLAGTLVLVVVSVIAGIGGWFDRWMGAWPYLLLGLLGLFLLLQFLRWIIPSR